MLLPGEITRPRKIWFAGIFSLSTPLSTGVERCPLSASHALSGLWIATRAQTASTGSHGAPLYWFGGRPSGLFSLLTSVREANLSAERAPAEAPARVPGAYVHPGGARHSQAPPGQRAEASFRLTRRHRLSRSRDFDAVYRKGRSVSTRYLVLYSFPREEERDGEPRLGLAVSRHLGGAVERNRLKRRLRAVWDEFCDGLPPGHDFVLIARPGLADAAESRGFSWLRERVGEIFRLSEGVRA